MNRVLSLVIVLAVVVMTSIGMMYIADWMTSVRLDRRNMALADVVSFVASLLAIEQSEKGVPVQTVVHRIRSHKALESVPVVFATHSDIAKNPLSVFMVPGRGVEALIIVVDEPDPYKAIRRVWISDASLMSRWSRLDRTDIPEYLFEREDVVEGGDPFSFSF